MFLNTQSFNCLEDILWKTPKAPPAFIEDSGALAEWRPLFDSLLDSDYKKARVSILRFLGKHYNLQSLAWLERCNNHFEVVLATGKLKNRQLQLDSPANARLLKALSNKNSIKLREGKDKQTAADTQTVWAFPIVVGGEDLRSGLLAAGNVLDENKQRHIASFCREVASRLEILRLREELSVLTQAVQKFNEKARKIDSDNFWLILTKISAELMKAERCSLMIFDEESDSLVIKAATGLAADKIKDDKTTIGARVAAQVLRNGKPLVVHNVEKTEINSAPLDWKYKSKSFICYPIAIGERNIGVLNLTDKAGGEDYNEFDLALLHGIVPQIASVIYLADLKHKAEKFELMSITDSLTGLLNRRYLEERLSEETKRSHREGYSMSFMMIDVDDFKSYNDSFSHLEGDKALKLVAQHLKETLRAEDIAARYGGEEFSILLPQTTASEARIIAERVREHIAAIDFPNRKITISIGVATCSPCIYTADDIIRAADKALYEAKRCGKNNIQVYENLTDNHTRH